MKEQKLKRILNSLKDKKVLVVGDVMMDQYIWGKVDRISQEAPVPIVEVERYTFTPGGAANVVNNICALGGKAYLAGVIGSDGTGKRLKSELKNKGVDTSSLITNPRRPTTLKTRIIAHSQQVVRVDREIKEEISEDLTKRLLGKIKRVIDEVDALTFSDYNKGMAASSLIEGLIALAKDYHKIITIDPKPVNLLKFKGATVITPNQVEAAKGLKEEVTVNEKKLEELGRKILKLLECQAVLITRGEKGMSLFEKDKIIHIPAVESLVYDVTGAGDTVIGTLTLALSAGADILSATKLANYAAGVVVRKVGTATATPQEVKEMLK